MKLLGCVLSALMLFACSEGDNLSGKGGIWDETENTVRVSVLDRQGAPLPGARAQWISMYAWIQARESGLEPKFKTALVDSSGMIDVSIDSAQGPVLLEAWNDSLGAVMLLPVGSDSARLALAKLGSLRGSMDSASTWPDSVHLAGTRHSSPVGSDGSFVFPRVAVGLYGLMGSKLNQASLIQSVQIKAGETLNLQSLRWFTGDSVLIDDFEDVTPANRYHALSGKGWWYASSDSASWLEPYHIGDALVQGDAAWRGGQSLHVRFAVQSVLDRRFVDCGFDLEQGINAGKNAPGVVHDLSALDSLTFWAKGTGTVHVRLNGTAGKHMVSVVLHEEWTRYTLAVNDFPVQTWTVAAPAIVSIGFMATNPAELWLDQIVLHGVSEADLFGALNESSQ